MLLILCTYICLASGAPDLNKLPNYSPGVPLRVFSAEGKLIAEYGDRKRVYVKIKNIPVKLQQAFVAAEDSGFYNPSKRNTIGMQVKITQWQAKCISTNSDKNSYKALNRALSEAIPPGPIVMQLARSLMGRRVRTIRHLCQLIATAKRIESSYPRQKILEVHLNRIYLGQRAYGVDATARVYYDKNLKQLSLAQMAMMAGIAKGPSLYSTVRNPSAAKKRRSVVLASMLKLGYISQKEYNIANKKRVTARNYRPKTSVDAAYMAEMVRQHMGSEYGKKSYNKGYNVYTTIRLKHQFAANLALRQTLLAYSRRHGYRLPTAHLNFKSNLTTVDKEKLLESYYGRGGLYPAVVLSVTEKKASIFVKGGCEGNIRLSGLQWARRYISEKKIGPKINNVGDVLKKGDVIYVELVKGAWILAQVPRVQGALVSINPKNGEVTALVGGFDFNDNHNGGKFNRAIFARRQPGTAFVPFLYSAALARGKTPATLISADPIVLPGRKRAIGFVSMRVGLAKSFNVVAVRLLQNVSISNFVKYAERFGFTSPQLPKNLSLALGSGETTPYQLAAAYAVFANGGYRIKPYFISRIEVRGKGVIYQAKPTVVCPKCLNKRGKLPNVVAAKQVMSPQVNYQIQSLLRSAIVKGTGRRAYRELKRVDVAGKTGITYGKIDAWFVGYTSHLVASVWIGFDDNKPLGPREYGGVTALPAWISYMKRVLKGKAQILPALPAGMITIKINPLDGLRARDGMSGAIKEIFRTKYAPKAYSSK